MELINEVFVFDMINYNPELVFDEFWSNIIIINEDCCWNWRGCFNQQNYGIYKGIRASRISYEITYYEIPEGMFVLHKCDNPKCVNPKHLFLGTNQDNMNDMVNKGRKLVHLSEFVNLEENEKIKLKDTVFELFENGFNKNFISKKLGLRNM